MAGHQMSFDEVHRTLLYADMLGGNVQYQVRTTEQIQNTPSTERVWRPDWASDEDKIRDASAPQSGAEILREQMIGRALSPNEDTFPGAPLSHAYMGYEFSSGELVKTYLRRIWAGQKFVPSATPWEMKRSILCSNVLDLGTPKGILGSNSLTTRTPPRMPVVASAPWFSPVVTPGIIHGHAQVIGHIGLVNGMNMLAPSKSVNSRFQDILDRGLLFVAADPSQPSPPDGWKPVGDSDHISVVLTTNDGQILHIFGTTDRGLMEELIEKTAKALVKWAWENKWEILLSILIPEVLPVVVRLAARGRQTILSLVARARAGLAARTVFEGATLELAATATAERIAARGVYSEMAGITRTHHQAFIEAAAESDSIIVVRHTNPKSIPLIEKGCPGKPKNLEFINTSPQSGIVMANTPLEVAKAQKLGYYVVTGDGKTAARFIQLGDKEVPEVINLNSPFWKVEKGQVIDPVLQKPIVGDYDLMGVIDVAAPGRNVGLVAKNGELLTDVTNPIVQKAAGAVNKRLDMPRVLHGPQDMYKGFRKAASAYLPDGTVMHFETEDAVKAFYQSIGRQPRAGSYARPSADTPVFDELAARRAQKANKPTGWQ